MTVINRTVKLVYCCRMSYFVFIVCLFVVVVVVCEREVKYFGYEQHTLENNQHEINFHNPFLDNVFVQRNVNIQELNNEHHIERREIFGEDDRDEVSREFVPLEDRQAELSTVLLSVGCTGMLVTTEYVLTAAHCIHSDGHFKKGYSSLEVAVEMAYGLEWRRVISIFLPSNWTHPDWNVNPDYYDYAVLKIDPLSEDTPHVPIALTTDTQHGVNSKISVVGYFDDKPVKTKWLTTCEVMDEDSGIIWHECDVTYGGSGAGMYSMHTNSVTNRIELRTVGILSGFNFDSNKELELNYAVRINPTNYFYICSWTCQMKWCFDQLSQAARREIKEKGDEWILDKLAEGSLPYCSS